MHLFYHNLTAKTYGPNCLYENALDSSVCYLHISLELPQITVLEAFVDCIFPPPNPVPRYADIAPAWSAFRLFHPER